jgi:hypothetical protein
MLFEFHFWKFWKMKVIAEVNGLATAAGCQLVATCDFVIASTNASFTTPGVRTGLFWYRIILFLPKLLLLVFFLVPDCDIILGIYVGLCSSQSTTPGVAVVRKVSPVRKALEMLLLGQPIRNVQSLLIKKENLFP